MKYFIIEGIIKNPAAMNENILKEHIAYSQKAMDAGQILISGLKSDETGGVFIIKAESFDKVQDYLFSDPLKIHGIQEYHIIEFMPHYLNQKPDEWFKG
ncbi:hypothetical protein IAI10_21505 [Clostridium sp. 19966]|uniref:YciI family protein n=1 Tax=Clostridium sp. 19966 TaxID=2768166 RepID=UPI0028DDD2D2|nr:YciI family protein [Clostridium sp. 19966]MDT8719233.1 hypothetical protein [Clostridium sp. 19966]